MSFDLRLPHFTDDSTPEQLRQIKAFLYQHVEQLQWILQTINSEENKNTLPEVKFKTVDSVIATGSYKGWTYTKWESGTIDIIGEIKVKPENLSIVSGIFCSELLYIKIPYYVTKATLVCSSGTDGVFVVHSALRYANEICLRLYGLEDFSQTDCTIHVFLKGKLKTTEKEIENV